MVSANHIALGINVVVSPRKVSGAMTLQFNSLDNACALSMMDGLRPKNSCIKMIDGSDDSSALYPVGMALYASISPTLPGIRTFVSSSRLIIAAGGENRCSIACVYDDSVGADRKKASQVSMQQPDINSATIAILKIMWLSSTLLA